MTDQVLERLHPQWYADVARMILPTPVFEWIRSGAPGSDAPGSNEDAFQRCRVVPRVMIDVTSVDLSVTVLGDRMEIPILAAPMGLLGAVHPEGESGLARGMASVGAGTILAVNSTSAIEDVSKETPNTPLWLQLYNWDDRAATVKMIERAIAAGCQALVPLVNTPVAAAHVPTRAGFRLPAGLNFAHFETSPGLDAGLDATYLRWLVNISPVPVVAKGIMRPDDALRALEAGCGGVVVSNHGARQLPRSLSSLEALPAVARSVSKDGEVYLDGGVRTGIDVLIALALGARSVMVGRLAAYALAVGGALGVQRAMETIRTELIESAALCGVTDVSAVPETLVVAQAERGGS